MTDVSRQKLLGWVAVLLQFVALGGILLSTGSAQPPPTWVKWIGTVLLFVGLAVMAAAFFRLGSSLTPTPVPNGRGVVATGIYRWIRHPIYVGLGVMMAGVVLRSPGWWPLLWWLLLVVVLASKSLWEERMLAEAHPEYHEYRNSTSRFLPRRRK